MGDKPLAAESARHAHDWLFELIGTSRELLHTLGDGLWRVPADPVAWAWQVRFWADAWLRDMAGEPSDVALGLGAAGHLDLVRILAATSGQVAGVHGYPYAGIPQNKFKVVPQPDGGRRLLAWSPLDDPSFQKLTNTDEWTAWARAVAALYRLVLTCGSGSRNSTA